MHTNTKSLSQAEACMVTLLNQPQAGPCTVELFENADGIHELTVVCEDSVMSADIKIVEHVLRKEAPHVD